MSSLEVLSVTRKLSRNGLLGSAKAGFPAGSRQLGSFSAVARHAWVTPELLPTRVTTRRTSAFRWLGGLSNGYRVHCIGPSALALNHPLLCQSIEAKRRCSACCVLGWWSKPPVNQQSCCSRGCCLLFPSLEFTQIRFPLALSSQSLNSLFPVL